MSKIKDVIYYGIVVTIIVIICGGTILVVFVSFEKADDRSDLEFRELQSQWSITNHNPMVFTVAELNEEVHWPMKIDISIEGLNESDSYQLRMLDSIGNDELFYLTGFISYSGSFILIWGVNHYITLLRGNQSTYVSIGLVEVIFTDV